MDYYCHQCMARCSGVTDFQCNDCQGPFVEAMPDARAFHLPYVVPRVRLPIIAPPPQGLPTQPPQPHGMPEGLQPPRGLLMAPYRGLQPRGRAPYVTVNPPWMLEDDMHEAGLDDDDFIPRILLPFVAPGQQSADGPDAERMRVIQMLRATIDDVNAILGPDRFRRRRQLPLSPSMIARLPMEKITQAQVDACTQCTTCLSYFAVDESVSKLGCGHVFHRDCLVPWLHLHGNCPVCRRDIDTAGWTEVTDPARLAARAVIRADGGELPQLANLDVIHTSEESGSFDEALEYDDDDYEDDDDDYEDFEGDEESGIYDVALDPDLARTIFEQNDTQTAYAIIQAIAEDAMDLEEAEEDAGADNGEDHSSDEEEQGRREM